MGLSVDLSAVRPTLTIHWEHGFDDYYADRGRGSGLSQTCGMEEVQTVRWASLEEILEMIDGGQFIPYAKSLIELLFFRKDHRSAHTGNDHQGRKTGRICGKPENG